MITFRGTGGTAQSECSVRFSFLYTGDFNQAVLRAVYLDGAADVPALAIKKAASNAVTWDSADDGTVSVTAVELRSVRGLPFYAFTCSDGSVAYALACDESALDSVSGAQEIYEETMRDGPARIRRDQRRGVTAAPEEKRPLFGRMTDFVRPSETIFATVRKCYTLSVEKHTTG